MVVDERDGVEPVLQLLLLLGRRQRAEPEEVCRVNEALLGFDQVANVVAAVLDDALQAITVWRSVSADSIWNPDRRRADLVRSDPRYCRDLPEL